VILLQSALDYAGLFPPAGLGMSEAVRCYATYRRGPHRALLGRFVVPIARLDELGEAWRALPADARGPAWQLSVLSAGDPAEERARLGALSAQRGLSVRSVERRVASADEARAAAATLGGDPSRTLYLEAAAGSGASRLVQAIGAAGAHAKVRTGGVTADAFPSSDELARFVLACAAGGVPFKATAGLHHAVRADHRITYEPDSPCATMHGFLNLFVGAALFDAGAISESELGAVLEERAAQAFRIGPEEKGGVRWRDRAASAEEVRRARARLVHAFGTCSFEEPIEELRALGALA
jgi:hypothetical protein